MRAAGGNSRNRLYCRTKSYSHGAANVPIIAPSCFFALQKFGRKEGKQHRYGAFFVENTPELLGGGALVQDCTCLYPG